MLRDTLTVYRKEIKSILKDKTVLFMCVLLPFIFMFGEGKLMSAMSVDTSEEKTYDAYVVNAPADMKDALKMIGFTDENVDVDKVIEDIRNKNADILAVFPEDFKITTDGSSVSNIEVYYTPSTTTKSRSGMRRRILPSLPLSLPDMTRTRSFFLSLTDIIQPPKPLQAQARGCAYISSRGAPCRRAQRYGSPWAPRWRR